MLVDRTHRPWFIGTIVALLLFWLAYEIYYYWRPLHGPSGNTIAGIIFGILAYSMMWLAFWLRRRKKKRSQSGWKPQRWMRLHLWVGFLSYPLIFLHGGGLHFGHGLTRFLMWAFTLVIVTGVLGAILQHFMPRLMTQHVPMESIYYNIDEVLEGIRKDADKSIAPFRRPERLQNLEGGEAGTGGTSIAIASPVDTATSPAEELTYWYETNIRPYLAKRFVYRHQLCSGRASEEFFEGLRSGTAREIASAIDQLEGFCKEKRDLDRQTTMHRILHGWLLVHIPLSALVIVLGAIHAIMALHYSKVVF